MGQSGLRKSSTWGHAAIREQLLILTLEFMVFRNGELVTQGGLGIGSVSPFILVICRWRTSI